MGGFISAFSVLGFHSFFSSLNIKRYKKYKIHARQILISPFSFSLTHLEDYKETNLSSNNAFRSFPQEMVKVKI